MPIFRHNRAANALAEQVGTLTEQVSLLERSFRNLELDYLQTYDKVKRLMSRVAKRAAIDHQPDTNETPLIDDKFSHMDPISAEILRRRANGVR